MSGAAAGSTEKLESQRSLRKSVENAKKIRSGCGEERGAAPGSTEKLEPQRSLRKSAENAKKSAWDGIESQECLLRRVARDTLVRQECVPTCGEESTASAEEREMQLKLKKRTVDGILAIECSGRIVFGEESSLLRDEVKKAIADGSKRIVLNLGEVNYIDSGGLGTLVALHIAAHNAGGTIKLANLNKRVGDLMQVTKLLTVFEVHSSEYEALEAFRKAA